MTSRYAAPGRFGLLDVVVLIAMAVTATAFAAGLIINTGIDMMAGVIAGAALFIVMASSHYVITRQARSAASTSSRKPLSFSTATCSASIRSRTTWHGSIS